MTNHRGRRVLLTTSLLAALAACDPPLPAPVAPGPAPAQRPNAPPPGDEGPRRPPEFPTVGGEADRIAYAVTLFRTGDDEDVAWARLQIRNAGDAGHAALADAARAEIGSNAALLEQTIDVLLVAPAARDADLALAALRHHDADAVTRGARLLAALPGTRTPDEIAALAAAGTDAGVLVRATVLECLAKVGGDAAAAAAVAVLEAAREEDRPAAYAALASFRHEAVVAAIRADFGAEADPARRIAAADALVSLGDAGALPWLRSIVADPPKGPLDYAGAAVGVLAKAKDAEMLPRIAAAAVDPLGGTDPRVAAVRRLAMYPVAQVAEPLARAAESPDRDVRIEALDALCRLGADGAFARLERLAATGDHDAAYAAALVFGRLRRTEASASLVKAIARTDLDDDLRAMLLRALVLSSDPGTAELVARTIAADHVPYDAPLSLAYNAGSMLGDATPAFRAAMAKELVRALRGEFGELRGAGLVQAIRAAGICCGSDAAPLLAVHLNHADAAVQANAALALGYVAGPGTERDLKAAWWRAADPGVRAAIERAVGRAHYRPQR